MRKFTRSRVNPISIDRLVEICREMEGMDRKRSFEFGRECGITKHNVDAIRQMLGYSDIDKYPRLSAEERDRIAEEYQEEDVSMNELARRHGVNYNSVRCILLARDVNITNPRLWTKRQEMYLKHELKMGKPTKKIADEIGKAEKCIIQKIQRMKRDDLIVSETAKGTPLNEIAEQLKMKASSVAIIIKKLKKEGIIKEDKK